MKSLAQHAGIRNSLRSDPPTKTIEEEILESSYEAHEAARWSIPDDFLQRSHFERILNELDMSSSPGYPYNLRNPTNKVLFGADDLGNKNPDRVEEIWQTVSARIDKLSKGEEECDYIRLFIKPEPVKEKKLKSHKYRLISSVSVIDQIIDHMLFDDMNKKLYGSWPDVPSKVGWTPYVGGWKVMPTGNGLAIDKSSWDWNVHLWLIDLVLKLRTRLCTNVTDLWMRLALLRYKMLHVSPLFITSAGVVLRQRKPGVVKSGCVNTIGDNSLMQYILHLRICIEYGLPLGAWFMSLGDDTNQEKRKDLIKYLTHLAEFCVIKQAVDKVEFAGMLFKGRSVEPMYMGKHAFTILHAKPEVLPDIASAYTLLYHRSIYRRWFENMFLEMGLEIPPNWKRDAIYDGLE